MSKNNYTYTNLIKLCVGIDSVEHLVDWRARQAAQALAKGQNYQSAHTTRMWPRREAELLNGGSLYWVIKGEIQIRQRLIRLDEVIGSDGVRRCKMILDPKIIRTHSTQRRPFQGWRYLDPADAPPDLATGSTKQDAIPAALAQELAALGVR
jgi:hypothetical protein